MITNHIEIEQRLFGHILSEKEFTARLDERMLAHNSPKSALWYPTLAQFTGTKKWVSGVFEPDSLGGGSKVMIYPDKIDDEYVFWELNRKDTPHEKIPIFFAKQDRITKNKIE